MHEIIATLNAITRPQLLISAARFGLDDYRRLPSLRRLLAVEDLPAPVNILSRLLELEAEQEAKRRSNTADYRVARHVALLVALMAELRDLPLGEVVPLRQAA